MSDLATLRGAIHETWEAALDAGRKVAIGDVADVVIREHGDLVGELAATLARTQVMKMIRELARVEGESEAGQLALFGFPAVLAIPFGDDYLYMRSTVATWGDLVDARAIRAENVARAQRKLDIYDEALDKVRPVMQNTQLTLADALATMGGEE